MMTSSLLLLHGATGSAAQLRKLSDELSDTYHVHTLNFTGHGGTAIRSEGFSIKDFAQQAKDVVSQLQSMGPVNIFGYSMGGYVAMYMARIMRVDIHKIITLGTKFHWDEATAANECKMLQPDVIEQKVPVFAEQLRQRHHPQSWKQVLTKTAEMLQQMGKKNPLQLNQYADLQVPCLIMLGDKDKMVTREETIAVCEQLPNAQLEILPDTPHPIEQADTTLLATHIRKFLA